MFDNGRLKGFSLWDVEEGALGLESALSMTPLLGISFVISLASNLLSNGYYHDLPLLGASVSSSVKLIRRPLRVFVVVCNPPFLFKPTYLFYRRGNRFPEISGFCLRCIRG